MRLWILLGVVIVLGFSSGVGVLSEPASSVGAAPPAGIVPARDAVDDDEDEQDPEEKLTWDIQSRMEQISRAETARYDGKTLKLHYHRPERFLDDIELVGKTDASSIGLDPARMIFKVNPRRDRWVCFEGKNTGSILVRPRFKGPIEVVATVQFQLTDSGSMFFTTIHSDGKEFMGSDYGVHALHKGKRLKRYPSRDKTYHQNPRKWLDRTGKTKLGVKFDPEKSLLSTIHGAGTTRDAEIKEPPLSGRIGFSWHKVSFGVLELTIEGELDREWAKQALEEKRVLRY